MEKEAVMAHLTLQLGAAIIVPFDLKHGRRTWRNYWRTRALREAAATEAGLPALSIGFARAEPRSCAISPRAAHAQTRHPPTVGVTGGARPDGLEV
jgi:hypothetical protein